MADASFFAAPGASPCPQSRYPRRANSGNRRRDHYILPATIAPGAKVLSTQTKQKSTIRATMALLEALILVPVAFAWLARFYAALGPTRAHRGIESETLEGRRTGRLLGRRHRGIRARAIATDLRAQHKLGHRELLHSLRPAGLLRRRNKICPEARPDCGYRSWSWNSRTPDQSANLHRLERPRPRPQRHFQYRLHRGRFHPRNTAQDHAA